MCDREREGKRARYWRDRERENEWEAEQKFLNYVCKKFYNIGPWTDVFNFFLVFGQDAFVDNLEETSFDMYKKSARDFWNGTAHF